MSDESEEEEDFEESPEEAKGEAAPLDYLDLQVDEVIVPKSLTYEEVSQCLSMLGKDESGCRYAYLQIQCRDRKLTEISVVLQFTHVLYLDFGRNKLTLEALQCLCKMPYLLSLKCDKNIIDGVQLEEMSLLQVLNFSSNKICYTTGIKQNMLENLNLNFNFVDYVTLVPDDLPVLSVLEVRGNLIGSLRGVYPPTLETLYMAENKIQSFDETTMSRLVNLKRLHVRDNIIHKLNGLSENMKHLKYINLRKNHITKLREIRKLACFKELDTLVILENPVCSQDEIGGENAEMDEELGEEEEEPLDKFRLCILVLLPHIKRINKFPVTVREQSAAEERHDELFSEMMGETSTICLDDVSEKYFGEVEGEENTEYKEDGQGDVGEEKYA